jgi:hypothetical protein
MDVPVSFCGEPPSRAEHERCRRAPRETGATIRRAPCGDPPHVSLGAVTRALMRGIARRKFTALSADSASVMRGTIVE